MYSANQMTTIGQGGDRAGLRLGYCSIARESVWAGGRKTTICSSYLPFIQLTGENQYSFRFVQARYETMSESKNETVTICHQLKKLAQICPC